MNLDGNLLIRTEGISKSYGGVQALSNVSFDLEGNTILGLIGDNGAGKTTLLKILNGYETRDKGDIYLGDETVDFSNPQEARDAGIAMTYETAALVDNAPVWENFYMGRELGNSLGPIKTIKKSDMKRRVAEILNNYGFEFDVTKQASDLSGGQRRILVVSRAIESGPKVLLLDEPFRGLSERAITQVWDILEEFTQEGSVIITSQWYSAIEAGIDEVMIMRQGQKVDQFDNSDATRKRCNRLMMEGGDRE